MTGPWEQRLRNIAQTGPWGLPERARLEASLEQLKRAVDHAASEPGITGEGGQAATGAFTDLSTEIAGLIRYLDVELPAALDHANEVRGRARQRLDELGTGELTPAQTALIRGAAIGARVVLGPLSIIVGENAIGAANQYLGAQRESRARQAVITTSHELDDVAIPAPPGPAGAKKGVDGGRNDGGRSGVPSGDGGSPGGPSIESYPDFGVDPLNPGGPTPWNPTAPPVAPGTPDGTARPPGLSEPPTAPPPGTTNPPGVTHPPGPPTVIIPTPDGPPTTIVPTPDGPVGGGTGTGPGVGVGAPGSGAGGSGGLGGGLGGSGGLTSGLIAGAGGAAALGGLGRATAAGGLGRLGGAIGVGGPGGLGGAGVRAGGIGGGLTANAGSGAASGGGLLGARGGAGAVGAAGAEAGGARGGAGLVGGGAGAPAGTGNGRREQKGRGLGGPIAPRLDDDDEFGPRSENAGAGGRD